MKLIKDEKPTFLTQEPQLDYTEWTTMASCLRLTYRRTQKAEIKN